MTCLPLPSSQKTQALMGHAIFAGIMVISCRVLTAPRAAQTRTCCTRSTAVSWRSGSTTRRRPSRATTGRCHVMPPCATCARAPPAPDLQRLSAYIHRRSVRRAALCDVCAPSHGLCGCDVSVFCLQLGCWDVRSAAGASGTAALIGDIGVSNTHVVTRARPWHPSRRARGRSAAPVGAQVVRAVRARRPAWP